MTGAMGPYAQLLVRRTDSGRALTVKVLRQTADRLGWLERFPDAFSPEAAKPGSTGRRPYGAGGFYPNEGGIPSGAWLADGQYRGRSYPRLRFRVTGPWTRSDLDTLREATVPDLHALTAGRLRWRRDLP